MSSIILGLFMSLGAAEAGELSWRWEGEQRFRSELVIETPLSFTYIGAANLEARAVQTVIAAEYRCTPTAVKKGWELDCAYTRVEMKGKALGKEQEKLNAIFAEYQRLLSSAHLQIQVRPDGGMRDLDLEGVAKTDARQAEVQEILRMRAGGWSCRSLSPPQKTAWTPARRGSTAAFTRPSSCSTSPAQPAAWCWRPR
jgi:hypothetical protein